MIRMDQEPESARRPRKRRRILQNETPPSSPDPLPSSASGTVSSTIDSFDSAIQTRENHGYPDRLSNYQKERNEVQELNNVCFGMIADIPVRVTHPNYLGCNPNVLPVQLERSSTVLRAADSAELGTITERQRKILTALETRDSISIQLYCRFKYKQTMCESRNRKATERDHHEVLLCVIIYGPSEQSEAVGDFVSGCELYLQDPLHCDRNVVYRNPHLLSQPDQEPSMTFALYPSGVPLHIEELSASRDPFSILRSEQVLPETVAPAFIKTPLYSHQKQALTFMLRREGGWALEDHGKDVWQKERDEFRQVLYVNTITGDQQLSQPPDFRGGLLADQMGLGKSLSMISLIASNAANKLESAYETIFTSNGPQRILDPIKTTLVIVPLPLLQVWDTQLKRHLHPGTLSWVIFYGQNRSRDVPSLGKFDIVITTYETVSQVWKNSNKQSPVPSGRSLYSFRWHRIVLDEAHKIQNHATLIAKAACALHATHRWAMSGTPIQNKLKDLSSIFQFLRIYPFDNPRIFDCEILKPCIRSDRGGFLRLKSLVNFIALCRTKEIVTLPNRSDKIHRLEFSVAEKALYDSAKVRTTRLFDDAIAVDYTKRGTYLNALQWLNALRLICNHGLLFSNHKMLGSSTGPVEKSETWNLLTAQREFESMLGAGAAVCVGCSTDLAENIYDESRASIYTLPRPRLSRCLFLLCGSCLQRCSVDASKPSACPHAPNCLTVEVSHAISASSSQLRTVVPNIESVATPPTKLKALLLDLQHCPEGEKSVVFSFWTMTLDLVGSMLRGASIAYTRLDGQLSADKRAEAIRQFQNDGSIQVILVSISCGGVGLDLTAASKAYLLEPQWNPMMEEQALSRIHRMGQKKEVTTIRYIMKDSFEEKVVLIQDRKKDLANLTFSNARLSEADVGAGRLQYLRAALG